MERFSGQHAVVTGGSSGIGLATARRVIAAGGTATLIGRDERRLAQACATLGGAARPMVGDVTRESDLEGIFAALAPVDHLVTAAGPMPCDAPILQVDIADARALFEGKYWGQLLTIRHAAPTIRAGGSITLLSGTLARKPAGGVPIFASIDGAIESLMRVLAIDLAPIRVNVVAPGIIDTPMLRGGGEQQAQAMLAAYADRVLVGRAGNADEVAGAIAFAMDNGFVTGSVIDIDGGKK